MVCGHAKQSVDVIWHHEEKQRMPSVDLMIVPDGTKQDGRRSIPGEFVASLFCGADRQKIDLAIRDPGRDFVGKVFSLRKFQGLTESNLTSFRQQNERRRRTVRRPDPTLKSASEMRVVGLDLRAGRGSDGVAFWGAVGPEARPYLARRVGDACGRAGPPGRPVCINSRVWCLQERSVRRPDSTNGFVTAGALPTPTGQENDCRFIPQSWCATSEENKIHRIPDACRLRRRSRKEVPPRTVTTAIATPEVGSGVVTVLVL